jgi:hypothetical protein
MQVKQNGQRQHVTRQALTHLVTAATSWPTCSHNNGIDDLLPSH